MLFLLPACSTLNLSRLTLPWPVPYQLVCLSVLFQRGHCWLLNFCCHCHPINILHSSHHSLNLSELFFCLFIFCSFQDTHTHPQTHTRHKLHENKDLVSTRESGHSGAEHMLSKSGKVCVWMNVIAWQSAPPPMATIKTSLAPWKGKWAIFPSLCLFPKFCGWSLAPRTPLVLLLWALRYEEHWRGFHETSWYKGLEILSMAGPQVGLTWGTSHASEDPEMPQPVC